jgi:hypothetical protein
VSDVDIALLFIAAKRTIAIFRAIRHSILMIRFFGSHEEYDGIDASPRSPCLRSERDINDVTVMHEPIDEGGSHHFIAQNVALKLK